MIIAIKGSHQRSVIRRELFENVKRASYKYKRCRGTAAILCKFQFSFCFLNCLNFRCSFRHGLQNIGSISTILEDLPKVLSNKQQLGKTCNRDTLDLALKVLCNDKSVLEDLKKQNLLDLQFKIDLNILLRNPITNTGNGVQPIRNFAAKFNFLHFLVILNKSKIVNNLKLTDEQMLTPVFVSNQEQEVRRKNAWIFGATSVHLAAMFSYQCLKVMITKATDKERLIRCPNDQNHRGMAPLHVAAMSPEPVAIK